MRSVIFKGIWGNRARSRALSGEDSIVAPIIKGVPASKTGKILKMPGLGKEWIGLADFKREGLAQLATEKGSSPGVMNNARLAPSKRNGWLDATAKCDGCSRT